MPIKRKARIRDNRCKSTQDWKSNALAAISILTKIEWRGPNKRCMICGGVNPDHADDCELRALLDTTISDAHNRRPLRNWVASIDIDITDGLTIQMALSHYRLLRAIHTRHSANGYSGSMEDISIDAGLRETGNVGVVWERLRKHKLIVGNVRVGDTRLTDHGVRAIMLWEASQ